MKKNALLIFFIVIGLSLFWGTENQRIKKSKFLGSTFFFPFVNSLQMIQSKRVLIEEKEELFQELMRTNIKHNALLREFEKNEFSKTIDEDFIVSEIIGYGSSLEGSTLLINQGAKSGVREQIPVLAPKGVIGKTIRVYEHNSVVLPLTHPSFRAAVMTSTERVQGILQSDFSRNSYMTFLHLNDNVNIGDTIVTSNLSGIFPKGYPVGIIQKIITNPGKAHKKALLERFIEPERASHVAVFTQKEE